MGLNFRVIRDAAPLKRDDPNMLRAYLPNFRVIRDAAPLKLGQYKISALIVHEVPRHSRRGPIEAIRIESADLSAERHFRVIRDAAPLKLIQKWARRYRLFSFPRHS